MRAQLISEKAKLYQRIKELEALETQHKKMKKALLESEEFSSSLLRCSPYPMIVIRPDTSIKHVNPALEKLTGFSSTEIIGKKAPYPWWTEETLEKTNRDFRKMLIGEIPKCEELFQKKNGERFWTEITPVSVAHNGQLRYYVGNWFDITDRRRAADQLEKTSEQLRNLSAYLQHVREEERACIAREIHDELGQVLAALKMDIFWIDKRLAKASQPVHKKLESMSTLTDTTLQAVRRISAELRPGLLDDLGPAAAIEWQAEEFQKRTGIKCKVSYSPKNIVLDRDYSTAIFRIFQEALTNIYHHANATTVEISLKQNTDEIMLIVSDNGGGITQEQISHPKAFGLMGMRERAYSWGGELNISGIQGKGTTVTTRIPLNKGRGK